MKDFKMFDNLKVSFIIKGIKNKSNRKKQKISVYAFRSKKAITKGNKKMKKTMSIYDFRDEMEDDFSYEACEIIFDALEDLDEDLEFDRVEFVVNITKAQQAKFLKIMPNTHGTRILFKNMKTQNKTKKMI